MWEGEILHSFAFAKPLVEETSQCWSQDRISRPVHAECYSLEIFEVMERRRQFSGYFLLHRLGLMVLRGIDSTLTSVISLKFSMRCLIFGNWNAISSKFLEVGSVT